jgi:hypothetical protein
MWRSSRRRRPSPRAAAIRLGLFVVFAVGLFVRMATRSVVHVQDIAVLGLATLLLVAGQVAQLVLARRGRSASLPPRTGRP